MTSNGKKSLSKRPSAKVTPSLDEDEWVIQIRSTIEEVIEEEDLKTQVSIFCLPQALVSCKPEAYVPQLFAFGPYHHWRQQLYDMERYKLASARRVQGRLNNLKFADVVEQFQKKDYRIRCHYHRYLDLSEKTLAWMMAIDACFLLEFLQTIYAQKQSAAHEARHMTLSRRMEHEKRRMGFTMIFKDVTMLENQIPLFLLRKLLAVIYTSKEAAEEELLKMLIVFVKELSPLKTTDETIMATMDNLKSHAHLLHLLYCNIVHKTKELTPEIANEISEQNGGEGKNKSTEASTADPGPVLKVFNWVWSLLSSMGCIKRVIFSQPVKLLVKFPWKVITSLPLLSVIKLPVESFFSHMVPMLNPDDDKSADGAEKPPLVEEIAIPSVTNLVKAGVKFRPTSGDITAIAFETRTVTMYLPVISLDANTEVVFRNLVAYEASAAMGPLVFTRYTELMYGIIDTEEDVKALRDAGIIVSRLKSDKEAAEMWNGMSRSVRLSKVGFLDKAIAGVNKYHASKWRVKCCKFMTKYVFGSWKLLTFLAAGLLLFMTCVQAFCSVYSCSAQLAKLTNMDGNESN